MVKRMLFFVLMVLSFAYSEPDNVNELIKKYEKLSQEKTPKRLSHIRDLKYLDVLHKIYTECGMPSKAYKIARRVKRRSSFSLDAYNSGSKSNNDRLYNDLSLDFLHLGM